MEHRAANTELLLLSSTYKIIGSAVLLNWQWKQWEKEYVVCQNSNIQIKCIFYLYILILAFLGRAASLDLKTKVRNTEFLWTKYADGMKWLKCGHSGGFWELRDPSESLEGLMVGAGDDFFLLRHQDVSFWCCSQSYPKTIIFMSLKKKLKDNRTKKVILSKILCTVF